MVTQIPPAETRDSSVLSSSGSPPSPTASFYDLSDDEEGGYNTITHTTSGRGVKLLFSKSKVYVHPTPSAKDNICGFVALVQQKPPRATALADRETAPSASSADQITARSLLLAWLPEGTLGDAYSTYVKVDLADDDGPPKQSYLVPPPPTATTAPGGAIGTYAFAIPVSEIYSILVRPPSIGWWFGSLVVNTRAGDSFPALFFHDSECQSTILQKKKRARESFDPFAEGGLFWGGDEVLRWLRRYVHVERSGADPSTYLVEPSQEDREGFGKVAVLGFPGGSRPGSSGGVDQHVGLPGPSGAAAAVTSPAAKDAVMDPLTKALKEARWSFLEKLSQVTNFTRRTAEGVLDNPKVPPQVRRLMRNPEIQTLQEEFDSARLYLARWAMGIAEQSERDKNQRIWTAKDVLEMEESAVGEFEILDYEVGHMSLTEGRRPVSLKEWRTFFDERAGRLQITPDEVKERIFHGGLDAEDGVRKEAWLFLLGVYDWNSSAEERKAVIHSKRDEYLRLKGAWWEKLVDSGGQGEQGEWWREQRARIGRWSRCWSGFVGGARLTCYISWNPWCREGCAPHGSSGSTLRRRRHATSGSRLTLFRGGHERAPGADERHAPDVQRIQPRAGLRPGHERLVGADLRRHAGRCPCVLGLCWLHGTNGGGSVFLDALCIALSAAAADARDLQERNFLRDQSGMRAQLLTLDHLVQLMDPKLYLHLQAADSTNFFFFFRMLLVWFKREFEWADVLRLWEGLWTDYLSSQFHLFIALAILEKHRNVIMDHLKHFDEVLKYGG